MGVYGLEQSICRVVLFIMRRSMELNWKQIGAVERASVITTVDAHAAGEPLRIITSGLPELQGNTILERRRYMQDHFDHIRRTLMWEPRGHRDMYGCILRGPGSYSCSFAWR